VFDECSLLFSDRAYHLDFKEIFFTKKFIVEEIAAYPPSGDVVIRVAKSPPRLRQVPSFAQAAEICLRERIPPPADAAEELMPAIEIPAPLSPIPGPSPQVAGPSNPARKQLNVSKSNILTFKNVIMLYWYFLKLKCIVWLRI